MNETFVSVFSVYVWHSILLSLFSIVFSQFCIVYMILILAIYAHLVGCEQFHFITNLMNFEINEPINTSETMKNCVLDNTQIIDSSDKWNILLIKEALYKE